MWLRILLVWLVMALLEIGQGVLRVKLINRRIGDKRARQLGVVTGSLVNLGITWWSLPWMGVRTPGELWSLGLIWVSLTLGLDLAVGRWWFRFQWNRIARDFDLRRGGWLGMGMLALLLSPWIAAGLRGWN